VGATFLWTTLKLRATAVINPIGTDFVYRTRTAKNSFSAGLSKKTPTSIFSQLKKVDVVISEPALDTCLFLIGALEFAGPYTLRQSPVLANRCLVIHLF
jgi:hypothetical protein